MRIPILFLLFCFLSCSHAFAGSTDDARQLLQMHEDVLRHHIEGDVDSWLASESADYVSANGGEISRPTIEERRAMRAPYLDATTFTQYRDLVDPVVRVAGDGTLGWVICQVQIEGERDGEPFSSVWAWIELYEKLDGNWLRAGNVSNRRE